MGLRGRLGQAVLRLAAEAEGRRRGLRRFNREEALLLLFLAAVVFPALLASRNLQAAAVLFLNSRALPLALLALVVNNSAALALVFSTAFTARKLSWVWLVEEETVERRAGALSVVLAAAVFAASLYLRRGLVNPTLMIMPHFWLEFAAVSLSAYAGFKGDNGMFALALAVLPVAAVAEVAVAVG